MEIIQKSMLFLHIFAGFLALASGLWAIVTAKGGKYHRVGGLVFFRAMLAVVVTAIALSVLRPNPFLLHIGIFVFFTNCMGFRAIRVKSLRPAPADWLLYAVAGTNAVWMLITGNPVLMVFGGLSGAMVASQATTGMAVLKGKEIPGNRWLGRHISMMMGTYIATFTAFLVVNVQDVEPDWLPWLLPTFFGSPLIAFWRRKYASTTKKGKHAIA
jgi:hypothetical protein